MFRRLWRHQFTGAQAVLFFVDSSDRSRLDESTKCLIELLSNRELEKSPFLIVVNKIDIENSLPLKEVERRMNERIKRRLETVKQEMNFVACSGLTNEGIFGGLDWLCSVSESL